MEVRYLGSSQRMPKVLSSRFPLLVVRDQPRVELDLDDLSLFLRYLSKLPGKIFSAYSERNDPYTERQQFDFQKTTWPLVL